MLPEAVLDFRLDGPPSGVEVAVEMQTAAAGRAGDGCHNVSEAGFSAP
jgi:hypothetical protein